MRKYNLTRKNEIFKREIVNLQELAKRLSKENISSKQIY